MKKGMLVFSMIILLTNVISALDFSYGNFGLSDILSSIDPQTMFLVSTFLLSFLLIFYSLSRVFRRNPSVAGIAAFCVAALITYGANWSGFDIGSALYGIGIDSELAFPILSILALVIAIVIWWIFSFGTLLMILGVLFIGISVFAYEKAAAVAIGIALLVLGFIFWLIRRKKKQGIGNFKSWGRNNSNIPNQPNQNQIQRVYEQEQHQQRE
jgi:hypothetical protein